MKENRKFRVVYLKHNRVTNDFDYCFDIYTTANNVSEAKSLCYSNNENEQIEIMGAYDLTTFEF